MKSWEVAYFKLSFWPVTFGSCFKHVVLAATSTLGLLVATSALLLLVATFALLLEAFSFALLLQALPSSDDGCECKMR